MFRRPIPTTKGPLVQNHPQMVTDWLVESMARCGINKTKLAKESGVPRSNIYKLLGGQVSPSLRTVLKLATAMAVKPPGPTAVKVEEVTPESLLRDAVGRLRLAIRLLERSHKSNRRKQKHAASRRRSKRKRRRIDG